MTQISTIKHQISGFMKHPLFSGSLIMIGGNMVVNVVNYVYHIIMGRLLGPVDYGVLASLYSILYITSIVPSSSSVAIVKFISSAKDTGETVSIYKSINRLMFYLAIGLAVVIVIFSPLASDFLHIQNIWPVVLVAPIVFFTLISLMNQATFQGLLKFDGVVGTSLISSLIKLSLGVILVLAGWSVFGAMFGVVLAAFLSYLYSYWYLKRVLSGSQDYSFSLKKFLFYAFPVLLQALAFTSLFTIDVILVKHFFSSREAGMYAALSTLGKIIFFASSPIAGTMFPIVSRRSTRGESYFKVFFAALLLTISVSIMVVIFYFLFPNIAIGVLYGQAYLSVQSYLAWMGTFLFFYTLSYLLVNFLLSLGRTRVVILPLLAALGQIILIWVWHNSLLQVIQISLFISTMLFLGLGIILVYNLLIGRHE